MIVKIFFHDVEYWFEDNLIRAIDNDSIQHIKNKIIEGSSDGILEMSVGVKPNNKKKLLWQIKGYEKRVNPLRAQSIKLKELERLLRSSNSILDNLDKTILTYATEENTFSLDIDMVNNSVRSLRGAISALQNSIDDTLEKRM